MVMVVERGDSTGALGLFQILVSYSQFCYVVLCELGENDSYHLRILSKLAENRKEIVLTVKQKLELTENFENRELEKELAKDYGVGIE
jgi:hypothetical protein